MFVKEFKCLSCGAVFQHVLSNDFKVSCLSCNSFKCKETCDSSINKVEMDCANCSKCKTCSSCVK